MQRRRVLLAGLLLLAGGCAAVLPTLQAPALSVTAISIERGDGSQQPVRVRLHASNPNDRAVPVRRIECRLEINGKPFAHGQTDAPFTLPALGSVDFDLRVIADVDAVLPALLGSLARRGVGYRVYGRVLLQGGLMRAIPFDQQGEVRL